MKSYNIDNGINLHVIHRDKFKSDIICILFREKLKRENSTKNAIIPLLLEQGCKKYKDNKKINKKVDEMFGATFDIQNIKKGEEQILQFYFEFISQKLKISEVLEFLYEVIYNTNVENGEFNKNIFDIQKRKIKNRIESQINNKSDYAKQRTFEISCEGEAFAINPLGYEDEVESISNKDVVTRYEDILKESNIDIIYEGETMANELLEQLDIIFNFSKKDRDFKDYKNKSYTYFKSEKNEVEKIGLEQSILTLTLKSKEDVDLNVYSLILLSFIIGGSSDSLLFKKIREELGLCYYAYSVLYTAKKMILIQCGVNKGNNKKVVSNIKNIVSSIQNFIGADDLNNAKNLLIREYKLTQDNNSSSVNFYLTQYLNDLETDLEKFIYTINNVSIEDVVEVSKKIIIDCIFSLE